MAPSTPPIWATQTFRTRDRCCARHGRRRSRSRPVRWCAVPAGHRGDSRGRRTGQAASAVGAFPATKSAHAAINAARLQRATTIGADGGIADNMRQSGLGQVWLRRVSSPTQSRKAERNPCTVTSFTSSASATWSWPPDSGFSAEGPGKIIRVAAYLVCHRGFRHRGEEPGALCPLSVRVAGIVHTLLRGRSRPRSRLRLAGRAAERIVHPVQGRPSRPAARCAAGRRRRNIGIGQRSIMAAQQPLAFWQQGGQVPTPARRVLAGTQTTSLASSTRSTPTRAAVSALVLQMGCNTASTSSVPMASSGRSRRLRQ